MALLLYLLYNYNNCMSFLSKVLEVKREEVKKAKEKIRDLPKRENTLNFEDIFKKEGTRIIAEVKKASPSLGKIKDVSAVEQARTYERAGAVAVSVLTDRTFFNGSLEDLWEVRKGVSIPILRKDFIIDPVQIEEARAFGADAVLLIVRILDFELLKDLVSYSYELSLTPLVEVFTLKEAELALKADAKVVGVNNRDLDSLKVDLNLSLELIPKIKEMGAPYVIAESGIESKEDVRKLKEVGADAFLVGTALMRSLNPEEKLKELLAYN